MRNATPTSLGAMLVQMGMASAAQPEQQALEKPKVSVFVRPKVQFKETMDAYRQRISDYNATVRKENNATLRYNELVIAYNAENQPNARIKALLAAFSDSHAHDYNDVRYNSEVVAFNATHGLWLAKRKLQTIKPVAELYFAAFLSEYIAQLTEVMTYRSKFEVATSLPEFFLNPNDIINQMRNGAHALPVCSRSVRAHRQRLEECGVLDSYKFRGHKRPVSLCFSPQILQVLDEKYLKIKSADNQFFNDDMRKNVPDTNVIQEQIENKKENKGNVHIPYQKESICSNSASSVATRTLYKNTDRQGVAPGADVQTGAAEFAEKFKEKLLTTYELAKRLANHEYDHHRAIHYDDLLALTNTGYIDKKEFRTIFIQDFFKTAAKLYVGHKVSAGCWYNAIQAWEQHRFRTFTGNIYDQTTILNYVHEYRSRLNTAIRCQRSWYKKLKEQGKTAYYPYPNDYFNPLRRDAMGSFHATKEYYDRNTEKKEKIEAQRKADAARYQLIQGQQRRFERKWSDYLRKKITMPELLQYVKQNLDPTYMDRITKKIENQHFEPVKIAGINTFE